jgi:hypothetical protein
MRLSSFLRAHCLYYCLPSSLTTASEPVILSAAGAKDLLCSNSRSFASRACRALAQDDKATLLSLKKEGENKGTSLPQARRICFLSRLALP